MAKTGRPTVWADELEQEFFEALRWMSISQSARYAGVGGRSFVSTRERILSSHFSICGLQPPSIPPGGRSLGARTL